MKNELNNQYPEMIDLPVGAPIPSCIFAPRRDAYERMRAVIAAVPSEAFIPIRVDVDAAVATVSGALVSIRAMREEIARELPAFDLGRFDQLQDRTFALHYVNNMLHEATAPSYDLPAMYGRAVELRDTLVDALRILARFRLVDASTIEGAGKSKGYRAVAGELEGLVGVMRAHEAEIAGKTPVTHEQLARAEALANEIYAGLDERVRVERTRVNESLERQQAFTLFLRASEGDADTIVPSIYAGRGGRGDSSNSGDSSDSSNSDDAEPAVVGKPSTASPVASAELARAAGTPEPAALKRDSIFIPASDDPFIRS